jgi:hypothetical protein
MDGRLKLSNIEAENLKPETRVGAGSKEFGSKKYFGAEKIKKTFITWWRYDHLLRLY